jgi:feruloyl esterase
LLSLPGWQSLGIACALVTSTAGAYPGDLLSCLNLANIKLPNTTFTLAQYVPPANGIPGYCQVKATVTPQTDVEVRLPDVWYNRYLHVGGGGFDGGIPTAQLDAPFMSFNQNPVSKGYAVVGSNGGHRREDYPGATFATDKTLTLNYASGAIYDSDLVGKAVVNAYYGQPAKYRYFVGCSNGGKNGSVAMATFADDYDGVVAGSGVYGHSRDNTGGSDMSGLVASWARNLQQPALSVAKGEALYKAQVDACDYVDGVGDGIIGNPEVCRFDPAALRCSGASNDGCLTDAEIGAVRVLRSDLKDSAGRVIGPPQGPGNAGLNESAVAGLANGFLAMAFRVPTFDPKTFDVEQHFPTVMQVLDGVYGMSGSLTGITRYLQRGKKLILSHGWDDPLLQPYASIRAFEALTKSAGSDAKNMRLYMLPGVGHCGRGPGADTADLVGAIANWVEGGIPPDGTVVAAKLNANRTVQLTRPLCAYPETWVYRGIGDPNEAGSYWCRAPN